MLNKLEKCTKQKVILPNIFPPGIAVPFRDFDEYVPDELDIEIPMISNGFYTGHLKHNQFYYGNELLRDICRRGNEQFVSLSQINAKEIFSVISLDESGSYTGDFTIIQFNQMEDLLIFKLRHL